MELGTIFGKAIISNFVKNSFPYISKKVIDFKDKIEHEHKNKLSKYVLNKYLNLNKSASLLHKSEKKKLSELYVPLTIYNKDVKAKIDKYPSNIFKHLNKIIIVDSAGMGKSTILKMLFRYAIEEDIILPFYIDMKSLIDEDEEKVINVIDLILKEFPSFTEKPKEQFLKKIFEQESYLFLFDGADEVPDKYKKQVYSEIDSFMNVNRKNKFIVATREENIILSSFHGLDIFHIAKLKHQESFLLIKKYYEDASEKLIKELNNQKNRTILEFLENPLLTTLLITAYSYGQTIPFKKSLFYRQVYQALFETHDSHKLGSFSREKSSNLDIKQFEKILFKLAYHGRLREQIKYKEKELEDLLEQINNTFATINFTPRNFINDLISRVQLFKKDGLVFLWQHKSIQEYFFTQYILSIEDKEKQKKFIYALLNNKNNERFRLVFDILYDEDTELFHDILTIPIIDEYINKTKFIESSVVSSINYLYKFFIKKVEYGQIDVKNSSSMSQVNISQYGFSTEMINEFEKSFNPVSRALGILDTKMKKSPMYICNTFYHKYEFIIEILFEKKCDFIYPYSNTKESVRLSMNQFKTSNILTNLELSKTIDSHSIKAVFHKENLLVIKKNKYENFIKIYNENKEQNNEFLLECEDILF